MTHRRWSIQFGLTAPARAAGFAIGAAVVGALASRADAGIVTFNSESAFVTATGATNATGPLPNLGAIPGGSAATQTVGSITFSLGSGSTALIMGTLGQSATNNDWTLKLPGNDIAITGRENLNATVAGPVFAMGFRFVEPENDPNLGTAFADSTFTVTLLNGSTTVDSFTFNAPNDVAAFVGVWSSAAFNRMEVRETTGNIENEFFGEFFTGATAPTTAVPLPSAAWIGLATLCLGAAGRFLKRPRRS